MCCCCNQAMTQEILITGKEGRRQAKIRLLLLLLLAHGVALICSSQSGVNSACLRRSKRYFNGVVYTLRCLWWKLYMWFLGSEKTSPRLPRCVTCVVLHCMLASSKWSVHTKNLILQICAKITWEDCNLPFSFRLIKTLNLTLRTIPKALPHTVYISLLSLSEWWDGVVIK